MLVSDPAPLEPNVDVTAVRVREALGHDPPALSALAALTGDAAFHRLSAGQQGALLERFQRCPSAAQARSLRDLAARHAAGKILRGFGC